MSIVRSLKEFKKESFYCEICKYPLITYEDFEKSSSNSCCNDCYLQFCEGNKVAWKNGWRPEKTIVKDYILLKKKNNTRSNNEFKF